MSHRKMKYRSDNSQKNRILRIITVILAILLGVLLWMSKGSENKKSAELRALNEKLFQEEQAKAEVLKQKEAEDSFYQKLVDGFDVNVLVVGDSIAEGGQGEKGWCTLLQNNLRKTYSNRVSFTNVSMGGNASYAGYVRTMALNDDVDYDLAIICYGQNDGTEGFYSERIPSSETS